MAVQPLPSTPGSGLCGRHHYPINRGYSPPFPVAYVYDVRRFDGEPHPHGVGIAKPKRRRIALMSASVMKVEDGDCGGGHTGARQGPLMSLARLAGAWMTTCRRRRTGLDRAGMRVT